VLAKYVRDEEVIPLEDAIRKMTSLPANRLRLWNRGRINPGLVADLVIFDPSKVQDLATFEKPLVQSVGMDYVIISGRPVIDAMKLIDIRPGKVIRLR
jgi:N-acyl-D-aspartate/D-glutamate deacylase